MNLSAILARSLSALCLSCLIVTATVGGLGVVSVSAFAEDANALRPEVGKPLQAAQQAIQSKNYGQALARIKEAEAVSGRTAHEDGLIAQLRLIAAVGAAEMDLAAKAYETLDGAGVLPATQKQQYTLAIASGYFRAKDYANAATWVGRYLSAGGVDPAGRLLLVQAHYLSGQFAVAAKESLDLVVAQEQQGQMPAESLLQILAASANEIKDAKLYRAALIRLAADYPKQDYWADLIYRLPTRPGFSERLSLDVSRLSLAAGTLSKADQYMDYAEMAIQAGLPGEAQAVVDRGYASGVFGTGADAPRHQRLRDMVRKSVDADKKALDHSAIEAAKAASGDPLVNTGLDYYGYGQWDKAAGLIEQGIAKGGLKSPDDARLHLGVVYLAAGQKDKAIETLKAVKGGDGSADLAALWIVKAGGHPY